MPKRSTVMVADNKNDSDIDPAKALKKKIKTEREFIISKSKVINKNIDLTDHEVNKFLIIFHTLLETVDPDSEIVEETDGIVTDIILKIVLKISELIRQNVDSLPLPNILKNALKVIKEIFHGKKSTQDSGRGTMETELKEYPSSTSSSSGSSSSSETTSSSDSTPTTSPTDKATTTTDSSK